MAHSLPLLICFYSRGRRRRLAKLERMIETGGIEKGVRHIGAEQEPLLIDRAMRPAPVAVEVLKNAKDHQALRKNQKLKSEHS